MTQAATLEGYLLAGQFRSLLMQHDKAIDAFTEGLKHYPDEPRLYRLRGHRNLNCRNYQEGLADLTAGAHLIEGQPDQIDYFSAETAQDIEWALLGDPRRNPQLKVTPETIAATQNMFKSTLNFSIYYHLALAHFLVEDYDSALHYYGRAGEVSIDDDARTAVIDWTYMTLLRLGRREEAQTLLDGVDTDRFVVNEGTPLYINRLRLYKGQMSPEQLRAVASAKPLASVTAEFAIGQWHLNAGRTAEAMDSFKRLLAEGDRYSFAYLVTERDQGKLAGELGQER